MSSKAESHGSIAGESACVLLTGGTGFIGAPLVERLYAQGFVVRASVRGSASRLPRFIEPVSISDLGPPMDWSQALAGVGIVVHTAARVHLLGDQVTNPLAEYRRVNVEGTLNLARQAAEAGVRRFVFLSSIKVNGERTVIEAPYRADDPPAPVDPYGISKWEAELGLRKLANDTGMEVVLVRPPLVYGPRVRANFLSMLRWLHRGVPLPFGAVKNKRSLVALDNLLDLLVRCVRHPGAANQIFLVSDGEDLSTPDILRRVGIALGKPARLFPVPVPMLMAAASVLRKNELMRRLCDSLQVDISKNRELLAWVPPCGVDDALRATALDFVNAFVRS